MLRQRKITIAAMLVFAMLCCCAFSFAAFTDTLTVNGTVKADGTFDVYFVKDDSNTLFTANDAITCNPSTVTCKLTSGEDNDKNAREYDTLNLAVSTPYDFTGSATFTVYAHNAGTVPAVISATGKTAGNTNGTGTNAGDVFRVTCTPAATGDGKQVIGVGETKAINITVTRNGTITPGNTYKTIVITLEYTQVEATSYSAPTHATTHKTNKG